MEHLMNMLMKERNDFQVMVKAKMVKNSCKLSFIYFIICQKLKFNLVI